MYKFLLLFLIVSSNLHGQLFQYGIGLHANFGYLAFDNKSSFEQTLLQPSISVNPGISLFAEIQAMEAFQFRIAGQLNQKAIRLSQNLRGTSNGSFKSSIEYLFLAFDLNVTAKYLIEGNAKWHYFPSLGFNVGFHQDLGYEITGGITSGSFNGLAVGLNSNETQSFIASNIQVGIGIKPPFTIFNLPFEVNGNFLYGPKRFLKTPIGLDPLVIQGKYHSLSIGLNLYLRRLKKMS